MERILLVTQNEKYREQFSKLVSEHIKAEFYYARTSGEAWRMMSDHPFAIVLILSPLPDEFGSNLAKIAAKTTAGVMVIAKGYQLENVQQKLAMEGVFGFHSEMGKTFFGYALDLMLVLHRRLAETAPQTEKLHKQIRDIRLVNRAKCLLIQYEGMSEEASHKYIEKLAMDQRMSRRDAAQLVLDHYETLQN